MVSIRPDMGSGPSVGTIQQTLFGHIAEAALASPATSEGYAKPGCKKSRARAFSLLFLCPRVHHYRCMHVLSSQSKNREMEMA